MEKLNFLEWFKKDLFGFEADLRVGAKPIDDELPTSRLNFEEVIRDMMFPVGAKMPVESYKSTSQMQWGDRPGAMRVSISPLGAVNASIHRLVPDLHGHHRWVCKKVLPLEGRYNKKGYERTLSEDLLKMVGDFDREEMERPSNTFDELEHLVVRMAGNVKRYCPEVFVFEGVVKNANNNYVIKFGVRGHGVQAKDQKRVEQYCIESVYDADCGIVRVFGYKVQSPIGGHTWRLSTPDFHEVFMPSQEFDDIVESVVRHLKFRY